MKWLIRTSIALGLLACLGYASYAFGMYVLSKKLFGDTVLENSVAAAGSHSATVTKSVTRKSRDKNAQAGAQVNVLDARDAGPGPEAPSLDTLERETRARDYDTPRTPSRQRIISAESLKTIAPKTDSSVSDSTNPDENRPRRRRRRRRSATETTTAPTTARNEAAPSDNPAADSSSPAPSQDASTRDTTSSSSSAPRDTSSAGSSAVSNSSVRPVRNRRRRRESISDSGSSSRREKRIESPVPGGGSGGAKSDSGSSGGDSPVPVPE